jgi:hypothetical protein
MWWARFYSTSQSHPRTESKHPIYVNTQQTIESNHEQIPCNRDYNPFYGYLAFFDSFCSSHVYIQRKIARTNKSNLSENLEFFTNETSAIIFTNRNPPQWLNKFKPEIEIHHIHSKIKTWIHEPRRVKI